MLSQGCTSFGHLLHRCADRLLLQRMRKSQSGTTLYGDSLIPPPLPPPAEPLHPAVTAAAAAVDPVMYPTLEAGQSSQRLLVVANRLPVSAHKDRDGAWQFEVTSLTAVVLDALPAIRSGVSRMKPASWLMYSGGPLRDVAIRYLSLMSCFFGCGSPGNRSNMAGFGGTTAVAKAAASLRGSQQTC